MVQMFKFSDGLTWALHYSEPGAQLGTEPSVKNWTLSQEWIIDHSYCECMTLSSVVRLPSTFPAGGLWPDFLRADLRAD